MKLIANIRTRITGLLDTMKRFPLTILLLATAAVMNYILINTHTNKNISDLMITMYFGVILSADLQLGFERFFGKNIFRVFLAGFAIVGCVIYYLIIHNVNKSTEVLIRVVIIDFILLIAFLWIPVIRSRYDFNQSFMAVFKGVFTALFFTGILYLGIIIVISAINILIVPVSEYSYVNAANIIFLFLAPVYFLSLIPSYPKASLEEDQEREDKIIKATSPAKFLETLISYIIIPLTVIFTIILLLYIVINIRGEFWTNNLLEPLLISYSITVIIVYLLACRMANVMARYFGLIFPKILVPIVLFQTVSSVLRIMNQGVTSERYYVILFGTFTVIVGIMFCILPTRRNGILAPILIVMALISITPPCDAFTVSKINQIYRLEKVLVKNQMLKDDSIIAKADITKVDQETIISAIDYLDKMNETKDVSWLSKYSSSGNFEKTFGFGRYAVDKDEYHSIYVSRDNTKPIPIGGYDYLINQYINSEARDSQTFRFEKNNSSFQIRQDAGDNTPDIVLEKDGKEILRFQTTDIFEKYSNSTNSVADTKELTFTKENDAAKITVIAQSININGMGEDITRYAEVYVMVSIKY